jgi:hypothetical protein
MAHFAELNKNNIVLRVIVVHNNELLIDGVEQESKGIAFCEETWGGRWIQTSYNNNIRKNYAGIGYTYDVQRDAFIPQQPQGEGWTLDENTCVWRNLALEAAQASINTGVTRV